MAAVFSTSERTRALYEGLLGPLLEAIGAGYCAC
jgi:hypothetical protein